MTVEDSDLALPQTLPEIFEAAAAGKELPPDLRSPQETPPSEEDSAEAERLKTEGEECPATWPPGAAGSRSQPVRWNRWRASLGVGVRGFYMDVET